MIVSLIRSSRLASSASCSGTSRRLLTLSAQFLSPSTSTSECSQPKANIKMKLASGRMAPSLAYMDRQVRGSAIELFQYYLKEIMQRLPTLTNAEWSEYLSIVAAYPLNFQLLPPDQKKSVQTVRDSACDFLADNLDNLKPFDYFNVIRFLQKMVKWNIIRTRYHDKSRLTILPLSVHSNIFSWFMRNYSTLEPQLFFEILMRKTAYATLYNVARLEKQEDIYEILAYGMQVAKKEREVNNILDLLYIVELYRDIFSLTTDSSDFDFFSRRLLEMLKTLETPANRHDLRESLGFLGDSSIKIGAISTRAVFHRYASSDPAAWKWLRRSIELVFEDGEFDDLRQAAAVAAVRAYKWKAIDFSPDDVSSYLSIAAEPFLTNPAIFFEPSKSAISVPRSLMLSYLITAIRSAANSDLPTLGKLTVRLDGAYWKKFFEMVEHEAPKLGVRVAMLHSLRCLKVASLSPMERKFVAFPFNRERDQLWLDLKRQYMQMDLTTELFRSAKNDIRVVPADMSDSE
uniref:Uncharacterized protein n=1 Tax=Plectus sambesii TaxID=2011161 RepID=A0A914VDY3_9BILA